MRAVMLSVLLLGSSVGLQPAIGTKTADYVRLDPIVVGVSIPDEHKIAWQERRKAWDECGNCVFSQEFPGEG